MSKKSSLDGKKVKTLLDENRLVLPEKPDNAVC
jgi:hypothetical protein